MGFLLGAFGKLSAGRRKREIQSQLMNIQRRHRRAAKDVAKMDKDLSRAEQNAKNQITKAISDARNAAVANAAGACGITVGANGLPDFTGVDANTMAQYNSLYAQQTSELESYKSNYETAISNYYENIRESQLEPLKQEEELLQTEKETLESQLQVAEQDYEACKQMEKDGAKNMKPEYTAGS